MHDETIPTSKTASFVKFKAFTKAYLATFQAILKHRATMGYRNMRFMRYVFKKKTVGKICDMIAPKDRFVIVGFGDWRGPNGTPISRKCTGPLQEIRRELKARRNVCMHEVDEAYSSKRCCQCHGDVANMKVKVTLDGETKKTKKVHKVLHCQKSSVNGSEIRCGNTFDRDFNAAKNILFLTMSFIKGWPRPERFKRPNVKAASATKRRKATS